MGGKKQPSPGASWAWHRARAGQVHLMPPPPPGRLLCLPQCGPYLPHPFPGTGCGCPQQGLPWTSGSTVGGEALSREPTALKEEIPGDGAVGGEGKSEDRRGTPPPLVLGSVLGAKGEAKAWPPQTRKTGIRTELGEGLLGPSKLWPALGL